MPVDLLPLPTALPAWTVRRPTAADVDAVLALAEAVDRATLGYSDWSREDVEADLTSSSASAQLNQLLVLDGDRPLAWALVEDRAAGRVSSNLAVDRELPPEQADLLAGWALRWLVGRAGDLARDRDRPDTLVDAALVDGDEAFADHWNHHPRGFAQWWRAQRESAGHDLDLWWLAELDGEPVGALLATTQMFGEGALFVATLGVRRSTRGRGVARSLLRRAFGEARRRGLERVSLTVDGANPTGATALYRSEGMDVDFAMCVLQRPVTGG